MNWKRNFKLKNDREVGLYDKKSITQILNFYYTNLDFVVFLILKIQNIWRKFYNKFIFPYFIAD